MWGAFSTALALLTRVPVPVRGPSDPRTVGRSILWYPAVGLIIGLLLAGLSVLAASGSEMLRAALVLTAWCLLTGGLHLDGLSDTADAFIGSHGDSARALKIMKDPAAGPMGVCAVCVLLILKFAVLAVNISAESWWLIVIAPVLGRTMIIALFLTTPYVRPGGLGESLAAQLPRRSAWIVLIAVFATAVIAGGVWAATGALLAFVLLRKLMMRMIGGTTGDTAGALVEVTETAALVAAAI